MTIPAADLSETEQQRQQRLSELAAEQGPQWAEQFKPGSMGCHELLDRTVTIGDMVEQCVLAHPACALQPEWYALAEQAVAALRELYQQIGTQHLQDAPAK